VKYLEQIKFVLWQFIMSTPFFIFSCAKWKYIESLTEWPGNWNEANTSLVKYLEQIKFVLWQLFMSTWLNWQWFHLYEPELCRVASWMTWQLDRSKYMASKVFEANKICAVTIRYVNSIPIFGMILKGISWPDKLSQHKFYLLRILPF
jgi:hypothetical protein